jgi:hypothetical protein
MVLAVWNGQEPTSSQFICLSVNMNLIDLYIGKVCQPVSSMLYILATKEL